MAKNKKNKTNESGGQGRKAGKQPSNNKNAKGDGKPKKAQPDHLKDIPFRLREIMKSKERMQMQNKKLKQALSNERKPLDSSVGDIPVPHFKRRKMESEKAYIRRMENETKHVLFLTENQAERKPEMELDAQEGQGGQGDKVKSEKKKEYDKARLQKMKQKKLDKQEDKLEKEMFIDNVTFGEVAMAPPSLSAKPKKAPVKSQKSSKELLLNSLLGHTMSSTAKPSMARQRIMEEERERAVEAYRQLKKRKLQQQEARTASVGEN